MDILTFIKNLFKKETEIIDPMKKYLIVGLGNIGDKYDDTRHNIGFKIVDYIAEKESVSFSNDKLGATTSFRFKGRTFLMLKPSTYMNLSGKSVKYWMEKEKISLENVLVVCDDLNITFGSFRIKPKGSAGGHNGLKDINEKLMHQNYARFRFGVGDSFARGRQVDYVLGKWDKKELFHLTERLEQSYLLVKSFGTAGIANTMSEFNGKFVID